MTLALALLASATAPAGAQVRTAPVEGLRDNTPRVHALTNARVVTAPGKVVEKGTVLLRDGLVEAAGSAGKVKIPPDARVWDLSGKTVYPGFIEAQSTLGMPESAPDRPAEAPRHWNPFVRPELRAAELADPGDDAVKKLRDLGFAAAHLLPRSGVFRGSGCLVNLSGQAGQAVILEGDTGQVVAFQLSGGGRSGGYPRSLMGCIALIRQTLLDAGWHRRATEVYRLRPGGAERPESNPALEALAGVAGARGKLFWHARDELDFARALRVRDEFKLPLGGFFGNGYEYRKAPALKASGCIVVIPLDFPEAPAVEKVELALEVSLERLQHWELAPSNAAFLERAGVPFCLTTARLESRGDFWKNVRRAVKRGLGESAALAALTTVPAELLGASDRLGTLEPGKVANLTVASGDLFTDKDAKVVAVWVDGDRHEVADDPPPDPRGTWALSWQGVLGPAEIVVAGSVEKPVATIGETKIQAALEGEQLRLYPGADLFGSGEGGRVRLSGHLRGDHLAGTGQLPGGTGFTWTAERTTPFKVKEKDEKDEGGEGEKPNEDDPPPPLVFKNYPAGAYGASGAPPQPGAVLVKNATVWTCGPLGVMETADLLVRAGKIAAVGQGLIAPDGATVIHAEGKHVTPGLIDCHSHTAISRGVNEGSHAVTVEVRIGDVVDPTDINLYRQLAGGLTTANLLHGSANPMGGQNEVIKLRWGADAEGMKFAGAKPGVKFALGENVKQSNWGDDYRSRYPQTRMGVEQVMKDTFEAALAYRKARAGDAPLPPRRDLRLDAALEIIDGERIVHIHSYRQDEILMFCRLKERFGFTIGTFQHILEGYKVADALAAAGAGGSSFSDWWAYKFEVYDAIPHNGALLHDAGVVTSFNSDDSELARRLNTEAAKAVKYGGVSEAEALKFVTLNPAIQLRVDARVGSLESGKDADFVLWSGHPLSNYSRAEQTWIEGRRYFDLKADRSTRAKVAAERERLVQKALDVRIKKGGEKEEEGGGGESGTERKKDPPHRHDGGHGARGDLADAIYSGFKELEHRALYHDGAALHLCTESADHQH